MNEHTGFELPLSDYEKGYLKAFFHFAVLPDRPADGEDWEQWYGVELGDRMFDLNAWIDADTGHAVCVAYESEKTGDNEYTVSMASSWFVQEANDGQSE